MLWFILGQRMDVWVADLSSVERFVSRVIVVEEEHVNKGDEETGSILRGMCIV